jgi:hypothetical protein
MDALTGWAGKMFLKQKMGNITDSLPSLTGGKENETKKPTAAPTSKQMRESIKSIRAERDAEDANQKQMKQSSSTKSGMKMSERWAANKEANR